MTAVQAAHGDATEAQGRLRRAVGGDCATLPGVRLMASGLPQGRWNSADVDDPAVVDMAAVAGWYAGRAVAEWGALVPDGAPFAWGRRLLAKELMARPLGAGLPLGPTPGGPPGLHLRRAGPSDIDAVVRVDAEAFASPAEEEGPWLAPLLAAPEAVVAVAELGGVPVGTGYCLVTDGRAGPAANIGGVGVVAGARRQGVALALSHWLLRAAAGRGAAFAHLHADTADAARVYRRLGFADAGRLVVHLPT